MLPHAQMLAMPMASKLQPVAGSQFDNVIIEMHAEHLLEHGRAYCECLSKVKSSRGPSSGANMRCTPMAAPLHWCCHVQCCSCQAKHHHLSHHPRQRLQSRNHLQQAAVALRMLWCLRSQDCVVAAEEHASLQGWQAGGHVVCSSPSSSCSASVNLQAGQAEHQKACIIPVKKASAGACLDAGACLVAGAGMALLGPCLQPNVSCSASLIAMAQPDH